MPERNTIQRSLVLAAVNRLRCHATADEIYDAIAKEHPSISRGTVYRNLNRLVEVGQIRRVEIPGEADRYDHICEEHYHVQCVVCRRIFDVDMERLPAPETHIKDAHGFSFVGHDLIFKGICPDCQKSR